MCFQQIGNIAGGLHEGLAAIKLDKLRGHAMGAYRKDSDRLRGENYADLAKITNDMGAAGYNRDIGGAVAEREAKLNNFTDLNKNVQVGDAVADLITKGYNQAMNDATSRGADLAKVQASADLQDKNAANLTSTDIRTNERGAKARTRANLLQIALNKAAANRSVLWNQTTAEMLRGAGGLADNIYQAHQANAAAQKQAAAGGGAPVDPKLMDFSGLIGMGG